MWKRRISRTAGSQKPESELPENSIGSRGRGWTPTSLRKFFLNFQVKMQGFMHFCCEQLCLWPKKRDRGGVLIDH